MKRGLLSTGITLLMLIMASGCTAQDKTPELKTQKDKASYAIGLNLGQDFQAKELDIDPDLLAQGIKDVLSGTQPAMTEEEMAEAMIALQKEIMERQEAKAKEMAERNAKEGEEFLAANAKKEGIVTLPSGLQYKVVKKGAGKAPVATDTVTVHYRGTLLDGTEFDSSYKRNEPVTFPLERVIPGWTEALQLMHEGAKYELFIPAELAYGEHGSGQVIGPNATLVFEVELLKVN